MNIKRNFFFKIKSKCQQLFIVRFHTFFRIIKFKLFSNCNQIQGNPTYNCPALLNGSGKIIFDGTVYLGVRAAAQFYSSYIHIDARNPESVIKIGNGVWINNNACIISEGEGIEIEQNTLIGTNFTVYDSDFHDLNPTKRTGGIIKTAKVLIKKNVFIGSNVAVLKGVTIGENSVIAHGSIVTKSIPANVIAGGNPCKVIKVLD